MAARHGGDPEMNPSLRLAMDKAREANMPKDNIERAIKKGTGELNDGTTLEEIQYEGYGPGGIAILIKGITDNKNRTISEVRNIFTKHGGNMGTPGSVSYMFESKGMILVDMKKNPNLDNADALEMMAIDAGAEDIEKVDHLITIYTYPADFHKVKKYLEDEGVVIVESSLTMETKDKIILSDLAAAQKIARLIEALEDNEDVNDVFTNFDVPEELADKL